MSVTVIIIFLIILFVFELLYFRIADKFNIIDSPNHRSSHTSVTIRGGGIIFITGYLLSCLYWGFEYGYFLAGLIIISFISFMDDIKQVSKRIRILFHFIGAALLLCQLGLYNYPVYWLLLCFLFVIGTINIVNFMDGINGITGGYSLITILTLYYINKYVVLFTSGNYFTGVIVALVVFNFFNFRAKAKCFAGDVGSVSIAFIIVFFLLQLIIKSGNPWYLLLLMVYGLDTVTTICFRLIRKENIAEAHRSHFYQFLANEKKVPHLSVTILYMIAQVLINTAILSYPSVSITGLILFITVAVLAFIIIRVVFEGRKRILIG